MKRERLFSVIEGEWTGLMESFSGLPDSVLVEPGVVGEWSVRDLLGHIATWEEEALAALPVILEGRPLPRYASSGGIDAFNARDQDRAGNHHRRTQTRLGGYSPANYGLPGECSGNRVCPRGAVPQALAARHLRTLSRA